MASSGETVIRWRYARDADGNIKIGANGQQVVRHVGGPRRRHNRFCTHNQNPRFFPSRARTPCRYVCMPLRLSVPHCAVQSTLFSALPLLCGNSLLPLLPLLPVCLDQRESNAKIVEWSNGTRHLFIGKHAFELNRTDVTLPRKSGHERTRNTPAENVYLYRQQVCALRLRPSGCGGMGRAWLGWDKGSECKGGVGVCVCGGGGRIRFPCMVLNACTLARHSHTGPRLR